MDRHLPPLTWLRSFEAAARHESFTLAAAELGLTQTAVSQHVKLLEQELHRPLFLRRPRSLILTDTGKAYYPKLTELLNQIARVTGEIFGAQGEERLTLQINAAYSVLFLAPRLADFADRHPEVPLRLVNPIWPTELGPETVDLEIRYGHGNWPGWRCQRLRRDRIFPVVARNSPLLECEPERTAAVLSNCRRLTVIGYREGWPDWFRAAGIGTPGKNEILCDNSIMAYEVAAQGLAPALGRSTLVATALADGRLCRLGELSIASSEDLYLLTPESRSQGHNAKLFAEWLLSQAGDARNEI